MPPRRRTSLRNPTYGLADVIGNTWVFVDRNAPGFEEVIRPAVWHMVEVSYSRLGMILDDARQLDEYDLWEVCFDPTGKIIAFFLSKLTPFGVKGGLAGSDGSKPGREATKSHFVEVIDKPGHYIEASHRIEELALAAGLPVVCAVNAKRVLNKPIAIEPDRVHYTRVLANIGPTTKVMFGQPNGVPVTSSANPRCPVPSSRDLTGLGRRMTVDDTLIAHLDDMGSMLDL